MNVKYGSSFNYVSEFLQELEQKHKKLLELSEKVQADLNKKGEACKHLEEELKNAKEDVAKLEQLKGDLAAVLQDKLVLEEKLHRFQKALQTIQTVSQSSTFYLSLALFLEQDSQLVILYSVR